VTDTTHTTVRQSSQRACLGPGLRKFALLTHSTLSSHLTPKKYVWLWANFSSENMHSMTSPVCGDVENVWTLHRGTTHVYTYRILRFKARRLKTCLGIRNVTRAQRGEARVGCRALRRQHLAVRIAPRLVRV